MLRHLLRRLFHLGCCLAVVALLVAPAAACNVSCGHQSVAVQSFAVVAPSVSYAPQVSACEQQVQQQAVYASVVATPVFSVFNPFAVVVEVQHQRRFVRGEPIRNLARAARR